MKCLHGMLVATLSLPVAAQVAATEKISELSGGLSPRLLEENLFGYELASPGDFDGDGVLDLVVGTPRSWVLPRNDGEVWILYLKPDGRVRDQFRIGAFDGGFDVPIAASDRFGRAVAPLGDLDGDGICELAVGAYGDSEAAPGAGACWILFLGADGRVKAQRKLGAGDSGLAGVLRANDSFGFGAAPLGDLDGDGIPDLAVGALLRDSPARPETGAVFILFLRRDGSVRAHQEITRGVGGFTEALGFRDHFGTGLARLGDLDGDGIEELGVGAYKSNDQGGDSGAAYVIYLNRDGTVRRHQRLGNSFGELDFELEIHDEFGSDVAGIGDLNGDGVPDLAVGCLNDDDGPGILSDRGAVYVLLMNADGTVQSSQKISSTFGGFEGELRVGDRFGRSVEAIGDLDGDGVVDLAVGTLADDGVRDAGAAWILFLNRDGTVRHEQKLSDLSGGFLTTLADGDAFGAAVTTSLPGGVDDGVVPHVLVGAPGADGSGQDRGAVWSLFLDASGAVRERVRLGAGDGSLGARLADGDRFGSALERFTPGDRDGEAAFLVGAPGAAAERGAVWLVHLAEAGRFRSACPLPIPAPVAPGAAYGSALARLGDLDGDGSEEYAVGAPGEGADGAVWVLSLKPTGAMRVRQHVLGSGSGSAFGRALVQIGDLDGNGVRELVVGAPAAESGGFWVLYLAPDASVVRRVHVEPPNSPWLQPNARFGAAIAPAPDLDDEGLTGLFIGAPGSGIGAAGEGQVWLVRLGAKAELRTARPLGSGFGGFDGVLDGGDGFGSALAWDGRALTVGAPGDDDRGSEHGALWRLGFGEPRRAEATARHVRGNPPSLVLEGSHGGRPVLGGAVRFSVDPAATGHAVGAVFVGHRPGHQRLPNGTVLLVEVAAGELASWPWSKAPDIELSIPEAISLQGLEVAVQAVLVGNGHPLRLTNAWDLVLGAR